MLDLGTVVLEPAPVLASGHVLDEAGRPVADATVQAVESGTAATAIGILDRPTSVTDDDGRFVLFGAPPAARVELVAAAPGRTPIAPLAFEPGTTDLVLTLTAAAHLEATVSTPDGIGMWAFACALEDADGSSIALHVPLAERRASGEATWSRDDVSPGPAALVVRSAVSGDELVRCDVVLAAGERTDLGLVDLTDALPTFELSVQDEQGGYVGRFSARYVDTPDVQLLTGLVDPARLPRPHDGARIEVSATGYLPATATVTGDHVAVRLRRSTAVALRLPPGFPAPPERSPLHIGFERLSGDDAQGSFPFPRASSDNTYRLDLGAPGRFVARVYRTGAGINFLTALAEAEFEVTPEAIENGTPIELPFDLDAWTRALAAER